MIIYNIKSFITVVGFFIGLVFSIVMAVPPLALAVNTILFTIGFYSFANLLLSFYIKNIEVNHGNNFPKQAFEEKLDLMIKDLDKEEDKFMPHKQNFTTIIDKQMKNIEESQK